MIAAPNFYARCDAHCRWAPRRVCESGHRFLNTLENLVNIDIPIPHRLAQNWSRCCLLRFSILPALFTTKALAGSKDWVLRCPHGNVRQSGCLNKVNLLNGELISEAKQLHVVGNPGKSNSDRCQLGRAVLAERSAAPNTKK